MDKMPDVSPFIKILEVPQDPIEQDPAYFKHVLEVASRAEILKPTTILISRDRLNTFATNHNLGLKIARYTRNYLLSLHEKRLDFTACLNLAETTDEKAYYMFHLRHTLPLSCFGRQENSDGTLGYDTNILDFGAIYNLAAHLTAITQPNENYIASAFALYDRPEPEVLQFLQAFSQQPLDELVYRGYATKQIGSAHDETEIAVKPSPEPEEPHLPGRLGQLLRELRQSEAAQKLPG